MRYIAILILSALALCGYGQQGEVFTVVKVKGSIYNITAKTPLASGSVVGSRDQLEFGSNDAEAIAISSTRGKFIIKQPTDDVFGSSIAMASANSAASPIAARSQYSVRALEFKIEDFAEYLGGSSFFVIGDSVKMTFLASAYPLNTNNYVSVSYASSGAEVNVDLTSLGQNIELSRKSLFAPHTQAKEISGVTFYYLNADKQAINRIATVKMIFFNEKELAIEARSVEKILTSEGMSRKDIQNYLKQYLTDIYGNTDPVALQTFLTKTLGN